jgi:hypothetical protein
MDLQRRLARGAAPIDDGHAARSEGWTLVNGLKTSRVVKGTAALLFLSIFGFYMAMSPATTGGRGYINEDIDSGMRMLEAFNAWVKGRPVPPIIWTRHGLMPLFLDLPFLKLGKLWLTPDFMMSVSPILFTAGLATVLFLWLRRLTSPGMSLLLTLAAAFGTMLWPYAYIGLETKQSFFVMLCGYLALADGRIRRWPKLMLFAVTGGLAMTMKSTGIVLWPAFAYLIYVQFRGEWRSELRRALAVIVVMGGVWALGDLTTRPYWARAGGGYENLRGWLTHSPLQFFSNAIGVFGSSNKGLFVFAPVLLLSLFAIPRAWRAYRDTVAFSLLVTSSTLAFISLLVVTSDEVWGPRYMHVAVAPLVLCIGAAWPRFEWRKHTALVGLAAIGLTISFLGAFYYYGLHAFAIQEGAQNTMEWINGDPVWSEVTFSAREFHVWLNNCPSTQWTPAHVWVWEPPPGAQPWKTIDLQKYCQPQSLLLRAWNTQLSGDDLTAFRISLVSLVVGLLALPAVIWRTARETWTPVVNARVPEY